MILIDTSVWIALYRDRSGSMAQRISKAVGQDSVATVDCIIGEVLQGTSTDAEWAQVKKAMLDLDHLPMTTETWIEGARSFYDLQRNGITVRSTIDCCIALLAITHRATLLHVDRDFETIAQVRKLDLLRLNAGAS